MAAPEIAARSSEARAEGVAGSWRSARLYDPFLWFAEKPRMAEPCRPLVAGRAAPRGAEATA